MRACGAGIWTIYACVESVWARFQHRKGGREGGRRKRDSIGFVFYLKIY
jgi:hypothetical protein